MASDRAIQEKMHAVRRSRIIEQATPALSLWLIPPDLSEFPGNNVETSYRSTLVKQIHWLARAFKTPRFEPHITLIGNVNLGVQEATRRLQEMKGTGLSAISVHFDKITNASDADGKVPWHQSCVAVVRSTPQLLALQRKARELMLGETPPTNHWAPPLQQPHMSLAYATAPIALDAVQTPNPFVATHVALYDTTSLLEGAATWREVARVRL